MTTVHRPPRRSTLVLTGLLQLTALPLYAASGLLAPGWAVLALLALGLWFGVLTLGEQVLGWTA